MKTSHILSKVHIKSNVFVGLMVGLIIALFLALIFLLKPTANIDVSSELQTITQNIRKEYQKSFDYRGLATNIIIEKHILPEQMVRQNKIFSRLNNEILIGSDMEGNAIRPMEKTFNVIYLNLDKNKCRTLCSTTFDEKSGLVKMTVANETVTEFTYGGENKLPISKEDAQKFCKAKNKVMFSFE